ncbi:GNAT family N-acetyltransferase [Solicola gregarius]|uniref:GNAT family N-acetyltransferase n=1 Tax=Solicola gregarius TaxID=2908642 RepID=A0AA46TFJ2_9ACTN|nr:GNAT family N-acetyltransferase [Solicola gregarius]UYM03934.1 GNAT family N-acetyltransferase [Solicola gregarius]
MKGMRFPDDVPVLTDGVVTLRAHRESDISPMVEMARDPEFIRWTTIPDPYDASNARHFVDEIVGPGWERHHHRGWAIEYLGDDGVARFGGNIDVRGVGVADVGFGLHPAARGRGVMARAIRLALRWAFERGGIEVVHWRAHVGNVASLRTAWATGFTLHGTAPDFLWERGRALDAWTGSIRPDADGTPRTPWWRSPVIEGEKVRLRPFKDTDVPRMVEACSDATTRLWIPLLPDPYTEADARTYLAAASWQAATGSMAAWCIADPDTDELAGNIAVLRMNARTETGEIGYWMHPSARGRGMVSEATRLAVRHALTPIEQGGVGRRRLELFAATENGPSNAVARNAGFDFVGTRHRAERLSDGTYADVNEYQLLG